MPSSNMAILHHAPLKVLPEKFAKWEAILAFAKDMLLNGTLQSEIDKVFSSNFSCLYYLLKSCCIMRQLWRELI